MSEKRSCFGPLAWLLLGSYGVALIVVFFTYRPAAIWMFLGLPWLVPLLFYWQYRRFLMKPSTGPIVDGWVKLRGTAEKLGSKVKNWDGDKSLAYIMRIRRRNASAGTVVAMEFRSDENFLLQSPLGEFEIPVESLEYYFSGMKHRFLHESPGTDMIKSLGETFEKGGRVKSDRAEDYWREAYTRTEEAPRRSLHWVFAPIPVDINLAFSHAVVREGKEYTIIARVKRGVIDGKRRVQIFDGRDTERWLKGALLASALPAVLVTIGVGAALWNSQ